MAVVLGPEAIEDQDRIVEEYLEHAPTLALRFLDETRAVYERLDGHPRAYQIQYDDVRRALLETLPYAIFHAETQGDVYVLRVLHLRADPRSWLGG